MKLAPLAIIPLVATIATPALADMTATYSAPNNAYQMKVEIASNGNVKGAAFAPDMYFVTKGGEGYLVKATFKGPVVMRIADVSTLIAEQFKALTKNPPPNLDSYAPPFDLSKGGMVTINGRQGTAYYLGKQAVHPANEKPVVVIDTDPRLNALAIAMRRQFQMSMDGLCHVMSGSTPFAQLLDIMKEGAPIYITGMELKSVDTSPIPSTEFDLPAKPLSLDGVRELMGAPLPNKGKP